MNTTRVILCSHITHQERVFFALDHDPEKRPTVDVFRRQFFRKFDPDLLLSRDEQELYKLYLLPHYVQVEDLSFVRDGEELTFASRPPPVWFDFSAPKNDVKTSCRPAPRRLPPRRHYPPLKSRQVRNVILSAIMMNLTFKKSIPARAPAPRPIEEDGESMTELGDSDRSRSPPRRKQKKQRKIMSKFLGTRERIDAHPAMHYTNASYQRNGMLLCHAQRIVHELAVEIYGEDTSELADAPRFSDIYPKTSQATFFVQELGTAFFLDKKSGEPVHATELIDEGGERLCQLLALAGHQRLRNEPNREFQRIDEKFHQRRRDRNRKEQALTSLEARDRRNPVWGPKEVLEIPGRLLEEWLSIFRPGRRRDEPRTYQKTPKKKTTRRGRSPTPVRSPSPSPERAASPVVIADHDLAPFIPMPRTPLKKHKKKKKKRATPPAPERATLSDSAPTPEMPTPQQERSPTPPVLSSQSPVIHPASSSAKRPRRILIEPEEEDLQAELEEKIRRRKRQGLQRPTLAIQAEPRVERQERQRKLGQRIDLRKKKRGLDPKGTVSPGTFWDLASESGSEEKEESESY